MAQQNATTDDATLTEYLNATDGGALGEEH